MADLRADRYIEGSAVGLDLYRSVADLPIVSPHGHIDVRLLADPAARLDPPGRLFVTADHYVVRMLYSQGVPLERCGLGGAEVDDRAVWQLLADNVHLFALTPTGLWLRETLATVFGIEEQLDSASAETIYARVEEQLATPAFAPRALLDRFRVECLSTTDAAGSSLAEHRALADCRARRFASGRPFVPTRSSRSMRPAGARRSPSSRLPRAARSATTRRSSRCSPNGAPRSRRSARPRPITRQRAPTPRGLPTREASCIVRGGARRHGLARRRAPLRGAHAQRVRADELRRRARDAAPHRQPARPQRSARRTVRARHRRGHPGCDRLDARAAPTARGVRQRPRLRRHSVHARREHLQPRAGAARGPLSRRLARLPVVVPRQPGGHRPVPRPGHRDGRALQPRRLRRRRPRPDRASGAARPVAAPHVRLARPEGRRRLPRRGRGAPASRGSSPTGSFAARTGWTRSR